MLVITFENGIFRIRRDNESPNHTFGITAEGTIIGYKGRPVKNFPKGFCISEIEAFIELDRKSDTPTLEPQYRGLFFAAIHGNLPSALITFFERMINAGCTNYKPTDSDINRMETRTFKQWLKLAREFQQRFDHSYDLWDLNNFALRLTYENDKNVVKLLQHYNDNLVSGLYNNYSNNTNKWNRITKWMLDETSYLLYQLDGTGIQKFKNYFNEIFGLCEVLHVKVPKDKPFQNLLKLRKELENRQNQIISETLQKNQSERWAYEDDNFIVIVPTTYDELRQEGESQHNCLNDYWLQGYGNDLRHGKQYRGVVFVRRKDNPTKSYITCDFYLEDLKITQFLRTCNRAASAEDRKFRWKYQNYLDTLK